MLAPNFTHVYKEVNGCKIKADVYLPASGSASRGAPPVVLFFHGGALISGSRKYLPGYQARRLNAAGLTVVSFDYRLAPETKLAAIITDVQDAILWAMGSGAAMFGFNPHRIAMMGSSAGGYLSLMTGTLKVKPKAIVSFYGYGDILGEWYTAPSAFYCQRPIISKEEAENTVGRQERSTGGNRRYTYYFYCRQRGIWPEMVSGYHPQTDREALLRFCPIHNITQDYPPTLLLHGDLDNDVPYDQSAKMSTALALGGVENHLITVRGAGHGFDGDGRSPAVKQIFEQVVQFLQAHL